jgi:hypothetical protein
VTYDSDLNLIVINGQKVPSGLQGKQPFLIAYDIARAAWSDLTYLAEGANPFCFSNHVGIYAPNIKKHIYLGGNNCTNGNSIGPVVTTVSRRRKAEWQVAVSAGCGSQSPNRRTELT